jgi:hypothetical protein
MATCFDEYFTEPQREPKIFIDDQNRGSAQKLGHLGFTLRSQTYAGTELVTTHFDSVSCGIGTNDTSLHAQI